MTNYSRLLLKRMDSEEGSLRIKSLHGMVQVHSPGNFTWLIPGIILGEILRGWLPMSTGNVYLEVILAVILSVIGVLTALSAISYSIREKTGKMVVCENHRTRFIEPPPVECCYVSLLGENKPESKP